MGKVVGLRQDASCTSCVLRLARLVVLQDVLRAIQDVLSSCKTSCVQNFTLTAKVTNFSSRTSATVFGRISFFHEGQQ